MEKKSMLQYFRESAGNDQGFAERVVKTLVANRIYTIDLLLSKEPVDILRIKGIGPRAMNLISRVATKAECDKKRMEALYKKHCSQCQPIVLHDWFQKAGASYLESYRIEKILKNNGIKTIDDFMNLEGWKFEATMKGIAFKRSEIILKTRALISETRDWQKKTEETRKAVNDWNDYVEKKEKELLPYQR